MIAERALTAVFVIGTIIAFGYCVIVFLRTSLQNGQPEYHLDGIKSHTSYESGELDALLNSIDRIIDRYERERRQ